MSEHDTTASSKRRTFLKAGAGAAAVTMAGCLEGDDGPGAGDTGGDFRFGMSQEPDGLNPLAVSSAYSWVILSEIFEYGTSIDPYTFDVHPSVYTDWTVENVDSGEPDVYFDVRTDAGLTWSDGEEFTLDDVLFTYEFTMEANPGRYAGAVAPIDFVEEADNDWDVHLKLTEPVGTFDTEQLQLPLLPEHRWGDVDPAEFNEYQPTEHTYEVDGEEYVGPVGLGPGRITRYEPDTSVEITYRDDYDVLTNLDWYEEHDEIEAGGPFIDSVRVMIYASSDALQQAFLSEEAVDALYGSILPSNVPDVEEMEGRRIISGFDTGYGHYSFNMRRTPLDDTAFRQALGFAFDHVYWTEQLNRGTEMRGSFVMPPGYEAVRPDADVDAEINEHPATKAFDFVEDQPGVLDIDVVKEFLRSGEVITGEAGEYVGREYPGSITGVTTTDAEARHDYSWGEVESDVLDEDIVEEEIRINGQTVEEILGRPLQMFMTPPQDSPLSTQMIENFINQLQSLGIPIEREVMTFNTMLTEVYQNADFDIFPMGWTNLSPFATASLDGLFHSDNAHGPDSDHENLLNNAMGYGLDGLPGADDLIDEASRTMDADERNEIAKQAVEKIYLDYPTQINSYEIPQWPVNEAEFEGYLEGIPSPGDSYVNWQFQQIRQRE